MGIQKPPRELKKSFCGIQIFYKMILELFFSFFLLLTLFSLVKINLVVQILMFENKHFLPSKCGYLTNFSLSLYAGLTMIEEFYYVTDDLFESDRFVQVTFLRPDLRTLSSFYNLQ